MDNRKPQVFLDPSCNMQCLGFLKEISSGDGTVTRWEENEVRVTSQCQLLGQKVKVHFRSKTTRTVTSQDETCLKKKITQALS